jgi:hypothetical protein
MPPPNISKSPNYIHDWHGDEIDPVLAMRIGRQLHERYGLTIDSFQSKADEGKLRDDGHAEEVCPRFNYRINSLIQFCASSRFF